MRKLVAGIILPTGAGAAIGRRGTFTGGRTPPAGGIAASLVFGVLAALAGKSRDQN